MSETLDLLTTRRSVAAHLLEAPAPDAAQLDTILTVATRVPDHGKLAPWRFVIFEGEARNQIGEVIGRVFSAQNPDADAERVATERGRLSRAPMVIAVVSRAAEHPKIPVWEQQLSAGAVCMNLTWAANALGFATCWLTEWFSYNAEVRAAMGLAEHERIAGFVHIGHPKDKPVDRPRPNLSDVVTRWSAP